MLTTASSLVVRCRHGHATQKILGFTTPLQSTLTLRLNARGWQTSKLAQLVNMGRRNYSDGLHQDAHIRQVRNIGIIAHVDAGKTTTTERMLYFAGLKGRPGDVDSGNTVTDFLPLEREKGITIQSAAITMLWPPRKSLLPGQQPTVINLIDTPGHLDFGFEVIRSMPELDGAVTILDASKGVETNTEKVWLLARQHRVPTICYINKHDLPGASFRRSVLDLASTLATRPLVCQIPWWNRDHQLVGHVDVIAGHGIKYASMGAMTLVPRDALPAALRDEARRARAHLVETLADHDEDVMAAFLELDHENENDNELPAPLLKQSIRRLIADGRGALTPVFLGASRINVGVQPLLDAVVDYLPSPDERPPLQVTLGSSSSPRTVTLARVLEGDIAGEEQSAKKETKKGSHNAHKPPSPIAAVAHVFKVVDDPQRGLVSYVRVHHGTLGKTDLWNSRELRAERPLNILHIFADKTQDIPHLAAGHIGALTGLKSARTGDTLIGFTGSSRHHGHGHTSGENDPLRTLQIRRPEPPPPVAFIAMEPWQATAARKLEAALARLVRVDPSFRYHVDEKTETYVFSGRGRLHLEIALERLANFYKIAREDVQFGRIEVGYQECLLGDGIIGPLREVYDRVIDSQAGSAACTVSLAPWDKTADADGDESLGHQNEEEQEEEDDRVVRSRIERDGNLIDISIRLPSTVDPSSKSKSLNLLPIPPATIQQHLLNGVRALARGPRRGAPVTGCRVSMTFDYATDLDGGSGGHVQRAATHAVQAALRRAHAAGLIGLREPFVRVRIACPEPAAGAVQHDLVARRGGWVYEVRNGDSVSSSTSSSEDGKEEGGIDIDLSTVYAPPDPFESLSSIAQNQGQGQGQQAARTVVISAKAPLREMLEYDARLRDLTSGRQDMQMEPAGFEAVTGARLKALEG